MSKFNTIEEYNKDLIIRLKYIDLSDYFTYIYHNHYLLIENVFKYYNDYQTGYQKYLNTLSDDKINELLGYDINIKKDNNLCSIQ